MSRTGSMSMKEVERSEVIKALVDGGIKPVTAALQLGLTTRQVQRLAERFRTCGAAGMISAKRGKPGNRQLAPGLAQKALQLVRERYADFPPTFACEKLAECHGVVLSKETLRRLMIECGLWLPRRARDTALHQPRERRACLGELVQIDGSHHAWFEERAPQCTLLVYVDDATGRLLQLHFAETETTASYFEATRRYLERDGKPQAFYADRAAVFRSAAQNRRAPTQFQRALDELDIDLICANSPQAKGRVERMNRTLQNRLIKELRLHGISSIAAANAWCDSFVEPYNRRFERAPRNPLDLHGPVRPNEDLAVILSHREERKLSAKLTLQYGSKLYVLADTPIARAHVGRQLALHTYGDGRIEVRGGSVALQHRTQQCISAKRAPEVDSKTLDHVLDALAVQKNKRNRHYRNLSAPEVTTGVAAAKQTAARKAARKLAQQC
jgi:transposase